MTYYIIIIRLLSTKGFLQQTFLDLSKWELQSETCQESHKEIHAELSNEEGGHMPEGEVDYVGLTGVVVPEGLWSLWW